MISFAYMNYGIIFLLMATKPAYSKDIDIIKIEENLLSIMEKMNSNIRELQKNLDGVTTSVNTLSFKSDTSKIEENFNQTMKDMRTEIKGLKNNIKEVNTSVGTLAVKSDLIMRNQNAVQSKTENTLLKLEEKLIEDFSEAAKNISLEVSSNKEKPQLPFGNDTHLNEIFNFGINIAGKKNSCNGFPRTFLSIINALFQISIEQIENVVFNFKTCWKGIPKSMEGHTYFVTPSIHGGQIRSYCKSQDAKPFVPKSPEEFIFYIVAATRYSYSWYPINDIDEEGNEVLLDGTDYKTSVYRLEKWEPGQGQRNDEQNDCVRVNILGVSSWSKCHIRYRSICQRN